MKLNLKKLLRACGVKDMFYPGKRMVRACRREGAFKSHAVVFDWRNPDRVRVDVRAGLSGRALDPEELRRYPVSLQSPTHVVIDVKDSKRSRHEDDEDDEDEEGEGRAGKGGGGGVKPRKRRALMAETFDGEAQGRIPELGEVVEMVVMGTELAREAYGRAMDALTTQVAKANVVVTDVLAAATDVVERYMPPSFMEPRGDEQAAYAYDRAKNQDIGRLGYTPF